MTPLWRMENITPPPTPGNHEHVHTAANLPCKTAKVRLKMHLFQFSSTISDKVKEREND